MENAACRRSRNIVCWWCSRMGASCCRFVLTRSGPLSSDIPDDFFTMNADTSNAQLTDDEVRSAYSKLRSLTKEDFLMGGGSAEAYLIVKQMNEQESGLPPEERERRAELALAEGLVEVFGRAAEWIGQSAVTSLTELWEKNGFAAAVYDMLVNLVSYRSCHSTRLATKVSTEGDQFFKADELRLNSRLELKKLDQVAIVLQNMILMCDCAPAAIGRYRSHQMYKTVRELYSTCKDEEVLIRSLMLLSILASEKEAGDLLSDEALKRLVAFLGRIVRHELSTDHPFWSLRRRALLVRTLEKLATSNERVGRKVVLLGFLPLLTRVLDDIDTTQSDLRAGLDCLWTLSADSLALDRIARDRTLLLEIEQFASSDDSEQSVPAKNVLAAVAALGDVSRNTGRPATAPSDLSKFPKLPPIVLQTRAENKSLTPHKGLTSPFMDPSADSRSPKARAVPSERGDTAIEASNKQSNSQPKAFRQSLHDEKTDPKQKATATARDDSFPAQVFISYQSAFTDRVLKIKRAVEARGIACWMATEDMVGDVQDAIGEALMVAPSILICYSQSYRQSKYCKVEANAALRWDIPMIPLCVEDGYEADYWLGVITSAAPGFDCSTDEKLANSIARIEKELRSARRVGRQATNAHASHPPPTELNSEENLFHGQRQPSTNATSSESPPTQKPSSKVLATAPEASSVAGASAPLSQTTTEASREQKRSPLNTADQQQFLLSPTSETPTPEKEISHERKSKHKNNRHSTEKEDMHSQHFGEWNTKRTAQWLSSIGIYDAIPEENRAQIDGSFLKELRSMKHESPSDFEKYLKKIFHFEAMVAIKFRVQLDKLE